MRNAHLAVMLMRLFDARRLKAQFLPCGSVVIDDRTFTPAELDGLADALVGPHAGFVTKEVRHAALSDAENARQVRVLARVARWYAAWERDAARVRGE
ncbi:hypothetical protein [Deinococcus yavapaiensis]|uniref:hypothetical protein n=1 Tax=Deinococcus yavapaiensis TaxID=309889 RepID=UPI0014729955|nr:hypothetical protein [Deinococcus yavapaiensis]